MLRLVLAHAFVLLSALTAAAETLPVPSSAEDGTIEANGVKRRAVGQPPPPQTSAERIDAALAGGKIDAETALTYKVFADFEDPRLPDAYRGDAPEPVESTILRDVVSRFDTLSSATQRVLEPFLIPPFHQGSWYSLQAHPTGIAPAAQVCGPINPDLWDSVEASPFKIWYLKSRSATDLPIANSLKPLVLAVVPRFTFLLGRMITGDEGDFWPCRGGDNLYDIALVNGTRVTTVPYWNKDTASYIVLGTGSNRYGQSLKNLLVHEIFHVYQYTYEVAGAAVSDYGWLMESTAQWSMDFYTTPGNQGEEQAPLPAYLNQADRTILFEDVEFRYGSYLFFLYLTRTHGENVIQRAWDATRSYADQLEAVDSAIPGGFKEQWPKFALQLINDGSVALFQTDSITQQVKKTDVLSASGGSQKTRSLILSGSPLRRVASKFYRFNFTDPTVRFFGLVNGLTFNVTVKNLGFPGDNYYHFLTPDPELKERTKLQAMFKIGGMWKEPVDWTEVPYVQFCRDVPDEKLEELILIVTNSDIKERDVKETNVPLKAIFSNVGCKEWKGTSDLNHSSPTLNKTAHLEVTFERTYPGGGGTPVTSTPMPMPIAPTPFKPTLTKGSWFVGGTDSGCTFVMPPWDSGNLSGLSLAGGDLKIQFFAPEASATVRRTDQAGVITDVGRTLALVTCPPSKETLAPIPLGTWAVSTSESPVYVEPSGALIHGVIKNPKTGAPVIEWSFESPAPK
jgi:hypothetical protein